MKKGILSGTTKDKPVDYHVDGLLVFSKKRGWSVQDVKTFLERNTKNFEINYFDIHDAKSYGIKPQAVELHKLQPEYFTCKSLGIIPRVPMSLVRTVSTHYVVSKSTLGDKLFMKLLDAIRLENLKVYSRTMRRYGEVYIHVIPDSEQEDEQSNS